MIVREIKTNTEEVLKNFDYFNDYRDTFDWLRGDPANWKILRRLENGFSLYRHRQVRANAGRPTGVAPWDDKTPSIESQLEGSEASHKVQVFLAELATVCRTHGFSLQHEDSQGGFEVFLRSGDESDDLKLLAAADKTGS